jgi:large subunit ribosomal protein LX
MSTFEIKGMFRTELITKTWRPFTKRVEGPNEKTAMEKVYSLLGSKHGLKRNFIRIDEVKAVE